MSIFDILSNVQDLRKGDDSCAFNGYLEDYLTVIEEDHPGKRLFTQLFEADENLRICVNYGFDVNREVISNQIIRYKDASKLPKKFMKCPFLVYGKDATGHQFGLILYPSDRQEYLVAKGIYFALTEQEGPFESGRNEIVAMTMENDEQCLSIVQRLMAGDVRVGALQREIDRLHFKNFDELNHLANNYAQNLKDNITNNIKDHHNRGEIIYSTIMRWFLIKKAVYVHYMTNKDLLVTINENNIKKQRHNAKTFADQIPFIAFSEMWRI